MISIFPLESLLVCLLLEIGKRGSAVEMSKNSNDVLGPIHFLAPVFRWSKRSMEDSSL